MSLLWLGCGGHDLGGTSSSPGQVFPHRTQSLLIRTDKDWQSECSSNLAMLDGITANLERYMDLLSARQKTVASNIANADTPGYKSQDIDFQFEFMTLSRGEQPQIIQTPGLPEKTDGNNVNLDQQARLLSENQMRFNLASVLVRGQLKTVQEAIQGGSSAS